MKSQINSETTETEVKIRWPKERGDARERIERAGYVEIQPRVLESNRLFDRNGDELRAADRVLRLRTLETAAGATAIVTYKGPASRDRYKSREEIEFEVSDGARFELLAERLGFRPVFSYEKYRTIFQAPDPNSPAGAGVIALDETPIGIFLELEGPRYWIEETARNLGFSGADFVTASYPALYREFQIQYPAAPTDMTF